MNIVKVINGGSYLTAYHELLDLWAQGEIGDDSCKAERGKPGTLLKRDRLRWGLQAGAVGNDVRWRKEGSQVGVGMQESEAPELCGLPWVTSLTAGQ